MPTSPTAAFSSCCSHDPAAVSALAAVLTAVIFRARPRPAARHRRLRPLRRRHPARAVRSRAAGSRSGRAVVVTLLTTLGGWLSPPGAATIVVGRQSRADAHRHLGHGVARRPVRAGRRCALDRSVKDLADTNFALDQAAIVATTNVKGEITFVNDKFCEISKYSARRAARPGSPDHQLRLSPEGVHPRSVADDRQRPDLARRAAQPREGRHRSTGSTRRSCRSSTNAASRTSTWRSATTSPIASARKTQLREQAALARLGEMAAVVAHEVKNPLAGISGALQVIGGRMPPRPPRPRRSSATIVARVDSLNDIVQDLLVFARPREPQLGAGRARASWSRAPSALMRKDPAHAGARHRRSRRQPGRAAPTPNS